MRTKRRGGGDDLSRCKKFALKNGLDASDEKCNMLIKKIAASFPFSSF
jgi:hypothetical protein